MCLSRTGVMTLEPATLPDLICFNDFSISAIVMGSQLVEKQFVYFQRRFVIYPAANQGVLQDKCRRFCLVACMVMQQFPFYWPVFSLEHLHHCLACLMFLDWGLS